MADISVYGEAVFATTAQRERVEGMLEDFMQATENTMPYGGVLNYPAGLERVSQLHIDESSGPGLRWCYRIPQLIQDQYAADVLAHMDSFALTYNSGAGAITT